MTFRGAMKTLWSLLLATWQMAGWDGIEAPHLGTSIVGFLEGFSRIWVCQNIQEYQRLLLYRGGNMASFSAAWHDPNNDQVGCHQSHPDIFSMADGSNMDDT